MQNVHRQQYAPQPLAHPADTPPAPTDRTTARTSPKSPTASAVFRASTPAISDTPPHSFDSRKINRSEFAPAPANSGMQTRRSTSPDRTAPRLDHFQHA